jgi:hypothetical protein
MSRIIYDLVGFFFNGLIYLLMVGNVNSFLEQKGYLFSLKKELRFYRRYCQKLTSDLLELDNLDSPFADIQLNQFKWISKELDINTVRTVAHQLGYIPRNIVNIGSYDKMEKPNVAIVYPLNFNNLNGRYKESNGLKPFPTILWMTNPELRDRISKLEDLGWINKLYQRLQGNPDWLSQMQIAHKRYSEFRWNLLTYDDKIYVIQHGW